MTMQTDEMDELLYEKIGACRDRWLESQPEQCAPHDFSEVFKARLSEIGKQSRRGPWRILRIAAAVAVLLAALTLTIGAELLPSVRAFRSGVVYVLSQVLPKSTDQIYTTDADHEGETKRPVLGWLPEGMVETERFNFPPATHINLKNTDGEVITLFVLRIAVGSAYRSSFDTEDAQVSELEVNGYPALLSAKKNKTLLIWFIENYRCSLSGTLSTDEIVKIAENIILK